MDLDQKQYQTRNYITPRNIVRLPLSIPVSNLEDILNGDKTHIQAEKERKWVRSVNDHQFWSFQYSEHAEMIYIIMESLGSKWIYYSEKAKEFQNIWIETYDLLIEDNNARIAPDLLENFRIFKLSL